MGTGWVGVVTDGADASGRADAAGRAGAASADALRGDHDFRWLLVGQTTSQLGSQVSAVAVPLLAVVTLRASAFEVGLVGAASTLAFALIGLPAGAWLDRIRR